jgi:hypothetical protein
LNILFSFADAVISIRRSDDGDYAPAKLNGPGTGRSFAVHVAKR